MSRVYVLIHDSTSKGKTPAHVARSVSNLAFSHLTRGGRAGRCDVRRLGDAWLDEWDEGVEEEGVIVRVSLRSVPAPLSLVPRIKSSILSTYLEDT